MKGRYRVPAAVFTASGDEDTRDILARVTPHFAVIDPTTAGVSGPQRTVWMLYGHPQCRTIIYSSDIYESAVAETKWLIAKDRPVSAVVDVILEAVNDPV
ncbi:MAG: hypothetical protein EOO77_32705, partial [Oxalobacteraceae bacterium]